MSTTVYMNLTLPVVSTTLGPDWATELNAAISSIDSHDHSSGKGIKITPSGLNISSDLEFNSNSALALKRVGLSAQSATLTGASNSNSVHSVLGDLYFTNGSGVAVQLTAGGSIVSSPGAANSYAILNVSSNVVIGPSDTATALFVDTTATRSITLPSAAAVVAGRIYSIKDASGASETNNITLTADGSDTIDGAASITIANNYSTTLVIGNGVDAWYIL